MKGVMGYILEVDLSTGEIQKTKVPDEVYYNVLSGKGLGAWYCLKNIPENADPLGPDNILGFTSGFLTGTGALMSGRFTVVGKSPLTGGWGDASCGGIFSPAIKQCGVDAIFFRGISEKPVYLYMDNKTTELRDAAPYWGLDAVEAEEKLAADNMGKKKPRVVTIGQAGENLSCISGIVNEAGRIAARSGLGAVMGSKKLKAIVLAGTKPIPVEHPEDVREISKTFGAKVRAAAAPAGLPGRIIGFAGYAMGANPLTIAMDGSMTNMLFKQWGTQLNTPMGGNSGDSPVKNWKGSRKDIPKVGKLFDPDIIKAREVRKYHCYSCPLGCGGILDIHDIGDGKYKETHKPEYETLNQFGALLLNNDLESILYMNEMLNRAGMDSISAGGTIAFALECYENGIITKEDTDGLELTWGNADAIQKLLQKMIDRDGFGDVLADGSRKAAKRIGAEARRYAIHVGGMEPGAHDCRQDPALGLAYHAEPAPGKHTVAMGLMYSAMALSDLCSWAPPVNAHLKKKDELPTEENALATKANACYTMFTDGMGVCYYSEMMGVNTTHPVEYMNAASGWNRTGDDYMEVGERIQTMRQMFNVKQGIRPADVRLPDRMLGYPALDKGPNKGKILEHAFEQRSLHWKAFGWNDQTGEPLPETVTKLGIDKLLALEV